MKQFAWPWLRCWALLGAMLPWAAAVKFTQESNFSVLESTDSADSSSSLADVHHALVARSSRTSVAEYSNASDTSLDTVANGKVVAAVGGTFVDWAKAVKHVSKKLGTAAGNTFTVVGERVMRAPSMRWDQLDSELLGMAKDMGKFYLAVKHAKLGAYMSTFHAAYKLAAPVMPLAKKAAGKAMTLARKVGPVAERLDCIVGAELTDERKCEVAFADMCDCSMENGQRKSYTKATAGAAGEPPTGLEFRCVPSNRHSIFAKGFRLKASVDTTGEVSSEVSPRGGVKLPGSEEEVTYSDYSKVKAAKEDWEATDEKLRTSPTEALDKSIEDEMTEQPSGSCEGKLTAAVDAIVAFNPDNLFVKVETTGTGDYVKTEAKVSGWVRASVEASVTGEGTCSYEAVTGFPKKPVKKMFCFKGGCIIFAMQMLATLKIEGTLTGSITQTYDADFYVEGTAEINTGTIEESKVDAVVKDVEYKEGIKIAASATASVRVSVGPKFVVWPTPGLPVTFFPQVHAKAEASGSITYAVKDKTSGNIQKNGSPTDAGPQDHGLKAPLEMCAAAVLSIYMDMGITGFALPPPLDKMFDDVKELVKDTIKESYNKANSGGKTNCLPPGASNVASQVAAIAATVAAEIIASLGLPLQLQLVELLSSDKLFCKEPWKTEGFDDSPCAEELGCSGSAGPDGLPEPGVVKQPASPTFSNEDPQEYDHQCGTHGTHLAFGNFFLEIGDFRIAEHDNGAWLSVTHKDNPKAIVLFNKVWNGANQDPNVLSDARWRSEAWARPRGAEHVKGSIKMGFQFIQIGSFRLGADDFCLMVSHVDLTGCLREWKFNHDVHGPSARTVRDRPEGPPAGISVGWAYLQIGQFRLGYTGHSVVILNAKPGMTTNRLIEQWHSDGRLETNNVAALDNQNLRKSFVDRPAHKFPCPQIGDMAFGPCDANPGAWGDRFVQLGEFRLAAIDAHHFSVSHSSGQTAQIFRSDGTTHPGPRTDWNDWDRPIGFPHGVTFGRNFVQIGNFRLADMDGTHLTVSHISGGTAVIFRGDGHIFHGPWPNTDFNAWSKEFVAGPASGVRYGKHFLEIGNFRIGDTDGYHLVVSKGHQTIRIYRGDGLLFGGVPGFGQTLAEKPTQSHCGLIQSTTGTCPGITAGDGFLQFGDWRLATQPDHLHFSISHRQGRTALVLSVHGVIVHPQDRAWTGWYHQFEASRATGVRFGDHFIELNGFRIGAVRHENKDYLTISNVHFHGGFGSILAFARDGVRQHLQYGGLFAGPHQRVHGAPKGVTFGDRFVQIGKFRIGDVDGKRFSVAHVGEDELKDGKYHLKEDDDKTITVYKHDGPPEDLPAAPAENDDIGHTTVGRPFTPCRATEMH